MKRVLVLVLDHELAQRFERLRRHETRFGIGLLRGALAKRLLREAIDDHEQLFGWGPQSTTQANMNKGDHDAKATD